MKLMRMIEELFDLTPTEDLVAKSRAMSRTYAKAMEDLDKIRAERDAAIAERDRLAAKLKETVDQTWALGTERDELRYEASDLVLSLEREGRPCGTCYSIATWAEPLPHGGSAYRCDRHHKHDGPDEEGLSPSETRVAAPLRKLRKMLGLDP